MQLPRIINIRFIAFSGTIFFIFWLWLASDAPSTIRSHLSDGTWPSFSGSEDDVYDFKPVHSEAIREVCRKTQWNSSLVFTCDNSRGGVGHVRNGMLNCVRYAIGAGGSLVLPNIALREMGELEDVGGSAKGHAHGLGRRHGPGRKGMEYMFDVPHFQRSLKMSCPELTLIPHLEASANPRRRGLRPESLFPTPGTTGIEKPEEWQVKLYNWIDLWMSHSMDGSIVVDLEQSFLQYPTHSDGHDFAHQFGSMLKFRKDVRRLATKVVRNMVKMYELHVDAGESMIEASFLGVHLRTEDESNVLDRGNRRRGKRHVVDAPYTRLEEQAHSYFSQAEASNLKLIYAAGGNITAIQHLDDGAKYDGRMVISKYDLLTGNDRAELDELKWDQRALVDWLVLEKASEFAGVGHSSFSWNVALRRHELSRRKGVLDGGEGQRWKVWSDGLSTLYGVIEGYVESSGCMWP